MDHGRDSAQARRWPTQARIAKMLLLPPLTLPLISLAGTKGARSGPR